MEPGTPWTLKSLSADFNPNALKDTYEYSCFLARSNEYQHLMTLTSTPWHAPAALEGRVPLRALLPQPARLLRARVVRRPVRHDALIRPETLDPGGRGGPSEPAQRWLKSTSINFQTKFARPLPRCLGRPTILGSTAVGRIGRRPPNIEYNVCLSTNFYRL